MYEDLPETSVEHGFAPLPPNPRRLDRLHLDWSRKPCHSRHTNLIMNFNFTLWWSFQRPTNRLLANFRKKKKKIRIRVKHFNCYTLKLVVNLKSMNFKKNAELSVALFATNKFVKVKVRLHPVLQIKTPRVNFNINTLNFTCISIALLRRRVNFTSLHLLQHHTQKCRSQGKHHLQKSFSFSLSIWFTIFATASLSMVWTPL